MGRETTSERAISGGRWAGYEHGRIYWSADTGAHTVVGGFLEEFVADSGSRTHGFPSTDKVCGAVQGGCYQLFSSGNRVTWAKGAGHHFTVGDFRKAWRRAGYASGKLGYPIGDKRCGLPAGGCYQSFQKGSVHWSSATGAHWSTGGIRREWASYGWERGILGYPESDERCNSGGCWQWFQHGVVEWKPGRGTWATPDFRPVVRRTTAADVEDTYRSGCPVGPSSLRTITMSYWGFDGRARRGVMIVRSSMVDGVVAAFEEAYRARYEIYRMDNPNRWGGDDPKQMYANNTSGFNCRSVVGNPYAVSPHSYGIAVDINTVQNPYKDARGTWWPSNGHKYILGGGLNRPKEHPAVLTTGSTIVKALEKRGWFWGGRWANRDYQHFEND
nr:M15 family metallopeptidase [Auraticoccus cholistanensis]